MEKYPNKLCCFCNLGERSSLGQGDFSQIEVNGDTYGSSSSFNFEEEESISPNESVKPLETPQSFYRRIKNASKSKSNSEEYTNELDKVGHEEPLPLRALLVDGNFLYMHSMCAKWSLGINQKDGDALQNIEDVVEKSLVRKCSFCGQYGASVHCRMDCLKAFHFPCAAASGCFLLIDNYSVFCTNHLSQVPAICTDANFACRSCSMLADLSKLIMCSTCGDHYHTTCIGLADYPDTRSGWNCAQCSKCQVCRGTEVSEPRSIKCEQCQKVYHTSCLRPALTSVPKYGWKCNRCRVCTDCGSRTPGGGNSSRWHCHYTICDSCYQQRNKGFSCPMCHRAYRAHANKEMVKCCSCNRFVHTTCDNDADLNIYHRKKEKNPDYDYYCPNCKNNVYKDKLYINLNERGYSDFGELSPPSSGTPDNMYKDFEQFERLNSENSSLDGKAIDNYKNPKKRLNMKDLNRLQGKKLAFQKNSLPTQLNRKRSTRGKNRFLILNTPGGLIDRGVSQYADDDEKKLVLCSVKDKFILSQDICVMCGSVGIDEDGYLIACAQCGQCYHLYCANVKISKVILDKGWRCLDCTICEGCGKKNDEAKLILCDECDISYHIYCMSPPLDTVPQGSWKCKLCAICKTCGRRWPGKNSAWSSGYLECGPCLSQSICCICTQQYLDGELIVQCSNCERWLHGACNSIKNVEQIETYNKNEKFVCSLCRPERKLNSSQSSVDCKDSDLVNNTVANVPSMAMNNKSSLELDPQNNIYVKSERNEISENNHWMDGICMSEHGFNMIKSLSTEIKKRRKMRTVTEDHSKDFNAAQPFEPTGTDQNDFKDQPSTSDNKSILYKDGMKWNDSEGAIPEGFTISTNEEGIKILRKKRQRNLQKLGIGGFTTRNRAPKKNTEDNDSMIAGSTSYYETEKKKKISRKKLKSKLTESFPIYLQEAFFGKNLLDSKQKEIVFQSESDASNDCLNSSVIQPSKQSCLAMNVKFLKSPYQNIEGKSTTTSNFPSETTEKVTKVYTDFTGLREQTSAAGIDKIKRIFSLPVTTQAVDSSGPYVKIINQGVSITTTTLPTKKIPNPNICNPLDQAIKMEVMHKTSGQSSPQILVSDTRMTSPSMNVVSPDRKPIYNSIPMQTSCRPNQTFKTDVDAMPVHGQVFNQPIESQTVSHDKYKEQQPLVVGQEQMININTSQKPPASEEMSEVYFPGTQKTAEKMRRDEDLGEMATISAVLYANIQYPDLKQTYPNWNDRCKQILKKWRSLSTEKKAPFLLQAKDNRSLLRMRRAQHDQEKFLIQHKASRSDESKTTWKQHATSREMQKAISHQMTTVKCSQPSESFINTKLPQDNTVQSPTPTIRIQNNFPESQTSSLDDISKYIIEKNKISESIVESSDDKVLQHGSGFVKEGLISPWNNPNLRAAYDQNTFLGGMKTDISYQESRKLPYVEAKQPTMAVDPEASCKAKNQIKSLNVEFMQEDLNRMEADKVVFKNQCEIKVPEVPSDVPVVSEIEKLDQYENAGFGEILGRFGEEDDDDILKSLTIETGDDFNILEYADPELDETASNQNFLNKLELDENDKQTL